MTSEWTTKPLGELCTIFDDGDWIETKDQSPEGIRLIQTGNVGDGTFKDRAEKARYVSEETFKRLRCTEIFPNDCLISRLPDPVGRSCLLPATGERMITAVDCTIVRFRQDIMLPSFFHYYSQSEIYQSAVDRECTGTTRKRISRNRLAKISIPVPPRPEQQRIVAKLDEAFAAIAKAKENAEKNVANARAMFESELNAIFTKKGEGWEEKVVGDVCTIKSGTTVPVELERNIGDIAYVKVAEMTMPENHDGITTSIRFLNKSNVKLGWIIPKGAVIFPKRGGAILTNKKRRALVDMCADLNIMSAIPSDKIAPEFLYYYFLNVDMRKLGSGSSIPQINNYDINPLPIYFPKSKVKQGEITQRLRTIEGKCQLLAKTYQIKIEEIDALKQSLLQRAFAGQL